MQESVEIKNKLSDLEKEEEEKQEPKVSLRKLKDICSYEQGFTHNR